MDIAFLGAKEITPGQPNVVIPLCSSFTISNYSNSWLDVFISDIAFPVPPFDDTNLIPGIFTDNGDFTFADVSIRVEFRTTGKTGKAVIAYRAKAKDC